MGRIYKELIAEARELERAYANQGVFKSASMIERLAAAVRELAPPEGWRVTEYTREDGAWVSKSMNNQFWIARDCTSKIVRANDVFRFDTAADAIAALAGKSK